MAPRTSRLQRARNLSAATLALALAFTGLSAVVAPAPAAEAAPAPAFDCFEPRFFAQAEEPVGTVRLNTGNYDAQGDSVWTPLGPSRTSPNVYNALSFNPVDDYLYGTRYGSGSGVHGSFVRIDRDGNVQHLGVSNSALGTPPSTLWDTGEFDAAGNYYVASGNAGTSTVYRISGLADVTSATSTPRPTRTPITLSSSARIADLAYDDDGLFWAPYYSSGSSNSATIYRIDLNNVLGDGAGHVTSFPLPADIPAGSYGSAFTMTNGNLALIGTAGFMYQMSVTDGTTSSPEFELVSRVGAPDNQRSNATNCKSTEPSSLSIDKTGPATVVIGETITWEVTVTNEGPGITSGFVLTDTLPTGLSDITVESDDTACIINAAQTIATCNGGRLAVDESATVFVSATAPSTTGPLINSASVIGNEDPDPPLPAIAETEVVVATSVDQPVTVTDAAATSWDNPSEKGGTVAYADGVFTYTPPAGFSGLDSFTYETPGAIVTVHVRVSPLAEPDSLTTTVDVPISVPVGDLVGLGMGTGLVLDSVGSPTNGAVAIVGGHVVFTPPLGFSGTATFEYTLRDTDGLTVTELVTVTVRNVFTDGDAAADGVVTPHNVAFTIPLADVVTVSGAALDLDEISVSTAAADGEVSIDPVSGAVTYTPDAGYAGADSFELEVCDVNDDCETVVIGVTVQANTVAAVNDTSSTTAGTSVGIDVRDGDTSASGQAFALPTVTVDPTNGSAVVESDGTVTYTPDAGFSGVDSFTYQVCDTSHPTAACDTATVTVTVDNVFTSETAVVDGVATPQNTPAVIELDDIVTTGGLPVDPTEMTVTDQPANGTVTIDATTGAVTYTPDNGYTGDDEFELELCDANDDCVTVTIEITVAANSVAAGDDSESTPVDTAVSVDVRGNDSSVSGQPFALPTVTTAAGNGTTSVEVDGSILYTPAAGFTGVDTFGYTACDTSVPTAICDTATVTITVVNEFVPGPVTAPGGAETGQDEPLTIPLDDIVTGEGAALDPATIVVTEQPENGTLVVDASTGEFRYTPGDGFSGDDEFTFEVCDESVPSQCTTVTVQLTVGANVVTTHDDSVKAAFGEAIIIDVDANDTSATGRPLGAPVITTEPRNGEAEVLADGTIRYVPNDGFAGVDTFTYERCDDSTPAVVCDTATVTVQVEALAVTGAQSVTTAIAAAIGTGLLGLLLLLVSARRRRASLQS